MTINLEDIELRKKTGFHTTSSKLCVSIEKHGFLPSKTLTEDEQSKLIDIAKNAGVDTSGYYNWLGSDSVTFPKDLDRAIKHIQQGNAGGQGLKDITSILDKLDKVEFLDDSAREFMKKLSNQIQNIQNANPVIYIVDLSNLEEKNLEETDYDYFFRKDDVVPSVEPSRIIAKLIFSHQKN